MSLKKHEEHKRYVIPYEDNSCIDFLLYLAKTTME